MIYSAFVDVVLHRISCYIKPCGLSDGFFPLRPWCHSFYTIHCGMCPNVMTLSKYNLCFFLLCPSQKCCRCLREISHTYIFTWSRGTGSRSVSFRTNIMPHPFNTQDRQLNLHVICHRMFMGNSKSVDAPFHEIYFERTIPNIRYFLDLLFIATPWESVIWTSQSIYPLSQRITPNVVW